MSPAEGAMYRIEAKAVSMSAEIFSISHGSPRMAHPVNWLDADILIDDSVASSRSVPIGTAKQSLRVVTRGSLKHEHLGLTAGKDLVLSELGISDGMLARWGDIGLGYNARGYLIVSVWGSVQCGMGILH